MFADASAFGGVRQGTGSFTLGMSPEVVMRLEPTEGGDTAAIEKGLTSMLANLRLLTMLAPDRFGEKGALQQAVVSRDGGQVVVRAPWPYEGLDRGAALLAERLRAIGSVNGAAEPSRP